MKDNLQNLSEEFEGYSTKELLELLEMRMNHKPLIGVPKDKIAAMCDLDIVYKISLEMQH